MFYKKDIKEVLAELKTDKDGLSSKEVDKRLQQHGPNELKKEKKFTALKIFISQFKNAFLLLLIFAGFLSLILGEKIEAIAIFIIIFLNAILGFVQEYRAESAMKALEKLSTPKAKVMRDGKEIEVPAKNLVPGDIILIEAGDIIPADARLIEESSLSVEEASLTGESIPSRKSIDIIKKDLSVSDQNNMVFMGTAATYGKGVAVITSTGMKTEFGKIATSLQETKEVETPLQRKFARLAKQIGVIAVILILIVLISGTIKGTQSLFEMLLFSLVLAVATIPSALPVIVTVGLSKGSNDLAKKNMLIKKLPAAESLGAATIICSDKTGTITKNQMTVKRLFFNNKVIDVTGTGYDPAGDFLYDKKKVDPQDFELLLRIGYLCNDAKLNKKENKYSVLGDPTEGSLIVLGKKAGLDKKSLSKFKKIGDLPFDSDRKLMTVIYKDKKTEAYVKGAPDLLLDKCDKILDKGKVRKLTKKDRKDIIAMNTKFAEDALRVLGMAYRDVKGLKKYSIKNTEKDLVFVGLVGMIDPPHDEVKDAVKRCEDAGIKAMIITGDHAITTKAIAEQVGLFRKGDIILTGKEVEKMSDKELEEKIENVKIIARALPIDKLKVVSILQKKGHIVAMTGDGVNDAPAVKKADIGISMGITGTDVAKEVSKAILIDDNFATIVNAIEEGRNIYDKMIKSAKYLLACNSGEIFTILFAIMVSFPLPLLPLQVLLINLLTDSLPALGLGFESAEDGIMKRSPNNPKDKPITNKMLILIVLFGLIMGIGTLYMFDQYKDINLPKAQTVAFTTLVLFQMFAVMSSRSLYPSLKHLNPFSNLWLTGGVSLSLLIQAVVIYWAPLQLIFGTVAISAIDWMKIIGISSLGFIIMEISKFVISPKNNRSNLHN